MDYRVVWRGQMIGTARFLWNDEEMCVAGGQFTPSLDYQAVRGVFLIYTNAQRIDQPADRGEFARYYEARDSLGLTLETTEGQVVETIWIHIVDWGDLDPPEPIEIEVATSDPTFWQKTESH